MCTDEATCVDHIIPLHMGGAKYDQANCRPACQPCNLARNRRDHTPWRTSRRRNASRAGDTTTTAQKFGNL
ncbi:HNH endonuclease [Salinispora arenicola]|nr:HNH endonuclease [Salinispora arenicola]